LGHATNDQSMRTEAIEKLEWALRSRGGEYESEMYDARHGWMIPGAAPITRKTQNEDSKG